MAKAKVLKDFSELKPIDQKRIELAAYGILQIVFKGETNDDFKPKAGTQVFRVWKMLKLDIRQQIAWQNFIDDANLAAGKSGSVVSPYGESSDKGDGSDFRPPVAFTNIHQRRLEGLKHFLSRREKALLLDLLQDTLRGNGSMELETIGLVRSGYSEKVSARASGVTHCQCLLDRLADYYQI